MVLKLLDALRKELDAVVQARAASALARLVRLVASKQPCPNGKILERITGYHATIDDRTHSYAVAAR